jgi:tetratricopeptide (TPR) repeat protein
MRVIRIAVAAALCAVVALAIARNIVPRYQCSVEKKRTEAWLATVSESRSPDRRIAVARQAIPRLLQCVERDPSDYEALFLLGVARREAEQQEAALQAFSSSLALNERPETYTSVALLQLERGQAEEARHNLRQAAYFHLDIVDHVDHAMRVELTEAAEARQARLKARAK